MHNALELTKKLTFSRLFNLVKVYLNITTVWLFKTEWFISYPFSISIEPTNACNLSCPQCPTGLTGHDGQKGMMELEAFRMIIDKVYRKIIMVQLYFRGEPFLHKNVFEMIAYASEKRLYVTLSTNGHFIGGNVDKIMASGLGHITISLDGITPEAYQAYRKKGNFHEVMDGIRQLAAKKHRSRARKPAITLQMLVTKHNEDQLHEFLKLRTLDGIGNCRLKTLQITDKSTETDILPLNSSYIRKYKKSDSALCIKSLTTFVITYNLNILPCCYDKAENYRLNPGDGEINFFELTREMQAFRKKRYKKEIAPVMCGHCEETAKKIYL